MSDLEELRTRVEAAEEHFGLIADQQKGYSQRLIALLNITEQKDQTIGKLEYENEQLRTMLFSLLQSIEKGDTTNTLQDMDVRISAMTSEAVEIENKSSDDDLSLPAPEAEVTDEDEALNLEEDAQELDSSASAENGEESDLDEIEELVSDLESDDGDSAMTEDEDDLLLDDLSDNSEDEADDISMEDVSESDDALDSLETGSDEISMDAPAEESSEEILETSAEDETASEEMADATEDDIIAEIADNLEEVLPTEETSAEEVIDTTDMEAADIEASDTDDVDAPLEGLEDPLEDQILSQDGATEESSTAAEDDPANMSITDAAETPQDAEISAEDIPLSEDTDIDSFLDENADEEEKPGTPEIEDIMERISKQALSQGD
ncbi:hypothetical protein [uncultured Kiloniella sp.]|uniref:hypothetical protein n=1 Tax=uncultured Kiloniella sp. TaxID=1133091 RepID=UPI002627ADF3|nr:hypothetical protein [uncultured Kiloniella sp.]